MSIFKKKCKDPFEDKVKCEECKHWIDKSDGQRIEDSSDYLWYCPEHRKPYESVRYHYEFNMRVPSFYKKMEVDEHGEPVGYKKVK